MKSIARTFTYFLLFVFIASACGKEKKTTKAGVKMQEFIQEISFYTRTHNPQFILIPQNGEELIYNDIEEENGLNQTFLSCVDGWAVEELFYNGDPGVDDYRLNMSLLSNLFLLKKVIWKKVFKN